MGQQSRRSGLPVGFLADAPLQSEQETERVEFAGIERAATHRLSQEAELT